MHSFQFSLRQSLNPVTFFPQIGEQVLERLRVSIMQVLVLEIRSSSEMLFKEK